MKKIILGAATSALALASVSVASAADSVNAAFFLEWATPNQVAKVEKAYDDAMGVDVNWTDFGTGVAMTEAMLAGDIDISYSQGLAPFVNAVNQGAPIKMVGIAVVYEANDCYVRGDSGITAANATELEGKTVAVPLNTMADYSFRLQMAALGVDIDTLTIVDQEPADGAAALVDGSLAMACIFGGNSAKIAGEVGAPIMSTEAKAAANIVSFDVISVTESFANENPELVKAFMDVTEEANAAFAADMNSKYEMIAADAGMTVETTKNQMSGFVFPTAAEQLSGYFNDGGVASAAVASVGMMFATDAAPALEDYSATLDTSFLE